MSPSFVPGDIVKTANVFDERATLTDTIGTTPPGKMVGHLLTSDVCLVLAVATPKQTRTRVNELMVITSSGVVGWHYSTLFKKL